MPRPLRQDYPGATHHVFVRGVARSAVAVDVDRLRARAPSARAGSRLGSSSSATRGAYLPNHVHLLRDVAAREHLAARCIGSVPALLSPSTSGTSDPDTSIRGGSDRGWSKTTPYLLELARYLPLNPVRAGLCSAPALRLALVELLGHRRSLRAPSAFLVPKQFLEFARGNGRLRRMGRSRAWRRDLSRRARRSTAVAPATDARGRSSSKTRSLAIALAHFRHGYSQAEIARHLGVNRSQICRRLPVVALAQGSATLGVRSATRGSGPHVAGQTPVAL